MVATPVLAHRGQFAPSSCCCRERMVMKLLVTVEATEQVPPTGKLKLAV